MIYPASTIENTSQNYLPRLSRKTHVIYILFLSAVVAAIAILPFVYVDISVRSAGIIRPEQERTEIKPIMTGIIDSVYYKEGDIVQQGAVILSLKDNGTANRKQLNLYQINQRKQFIHDLQILTTNPSCNNDMLQKLSSPLYREQAIHYMHQNDDQAATLEKANRELEINTTLFNEKVISKKEYFDAQITQEKSDASYHAFQKEQQTLWQQDMTRYKQELTQYENDLAEVFNSSRYYSVKAPVTGSLQGISTHYAGSMLQANETLCTISPNGNLIAECYVSSVDAGLIKTGQPVIFQIDAFDYNYFGTVSGNVTAIDNDFTLVDNKPVFRVKCMFKNTALFLKNGYKGQLKKGLTFQARFVIIRRSLWHLLFDKIDDWLNPNAPASNTKQE